MVELHRSIHAVSRASGEPWHRAKAAMLVADCASEALTTDATLKEEGIVGTAPRESACTTRAMREWRKFVLKVGTGPTT